MARTYKQVNKDYHKRLRHYAARGAKQGALRGATVGIVQSAFQAPGTYRRARVYGMGHVGAGASVALDAGVRGAMGAAIGAPLGAAIGANKTRMRHKASMQRTYITYKKKTPKGQVITVRRRRPKRGR